MVYTIYMHLQSLISLDINNIDIDIKTHHQTLAKVFNGNPDAF